MTGQAIVAKVQELNLPARSYIVFGSCPLAAAGIREAGDIDLLVSSAVYEKLRAEGWQQVNKGPNDTPLTHDAFEAHEHWNFSTYNPTLEELLTRATEVNGVLFASLEDVRKWKAASGREKDIADIKRIDEYIAKKNRLDARALRG